MHLFDQFPILKTIPLFCVSSEEHVRRCLENQDFFCCDFSVGEVVYSSMTETVRVGVLLSGEAEIHAHSGDERTLLKTAKAGEIFGIANLYATDIAFPTLIHAKTAVRVLFFEKDAFCRFVETDPDVLHFYLGFLSKKIVYLNRKIATFTAGSAEHRLALFLLENQNDGVFTPTYPMTELSRLLGLGRASLYRAIERLSELALITHRDGRFYLLDKEALSRFSTPTLS